MNVVLYQINILFYYKITHFAIFKVPYFTLLLFQPTDICVYIIGRLVSAYVEYEADWPSN